MFLVTENTCHRPSGDHIHTHIHGRPEDDHTHHGDSDHTESWNRLLKDRWYEHTHPHKDHMYPDEYETLKYGHRPKKVSWASGTDANRLFVAQTDVDPGNMDTMVLDLPDCDEFLDLDSGALTGMDVACIAVG